MLYQTQPSLNLPKTTEEILKFWESVDAFPETLRQRANAPVFIFYEGPPSANGRPGIHHVLSRTIKDIVCRYKTQQGFYVARKGGWDTHGLPVELAVEQQLGIRKEDIGSKISIAEYNQQCLKTVMQYKTQWDELTRCMGYWLDIEQPYMTCDRDYIESAWFLLKQLHEKKLLYKGYAIQPYSPSAGTGLSAHELNQPGCYRDVTDTSVVAQFRLKEHPDTYFLAWTTTPWTLPANSALAVGNQIDYVTVRTFNPYTHHPIKVILAEQTLSRYFTGAEQDDKAFDAYNSTTKNVPWKIIGRQVGKDLVGQKYEQLMPYVKPTGLAFQIISGDFVRTDDGTGIVHIAPTFGADDARVAAQEGVSAITICDATGVELPIVDQQGRFVDQISDFPGRYVKESYNPDCISKHTHSVDVDIAILLKKTNRAFRVEKYTHSYPHCWRTDKPILYYPMDAWFIRTTAYKDRLIELNKTINWHPESTGTGRFGNWLENLVDWNLSRDRYWGIPLNIWRTKDQQEERCIESVSELRKAVSNSVDLGYMSENLPDDFDLHRPYVDEIILVSTTGKPMYRETAVVDVWFDSGAMPYAQQHYPFAYGKDLKNFPADFIAEGVDQTRGWFFTLHVLSVLLFDSVAFKNVVANGLVLDKQGQKMSKRLNNTVNPFQIMQSYGADALRWYMIGNTNPWDNLKFDISGVQEVSRGFFGTLNNTYNFFAIYADIDKFVPKDDEKVTYTMLDRWMLSQLHICIQRVVDYYETYSFTQVVRTLDVLVVDDLSNWYVRLSRKRFWKNAQDDDKKAAYQTLYTCLYTIARLMAPIAPFYSEQLYQNLEKPLQCKKLQCSVHGSTFPIAQSEQIDTELQTTISYLRKAVSLVHGLRKQHRIKVRQPLLKMLVVVSDASIRSKIKCFESLLMQEVNVKQISYTDKTTCIQRFVKPNFKVLGKQYGKETKSIAESIKKLSDKQIQQLDAGESIQLTLDHSEPIWLSPESVSIVSENIPGWCVASDNEITVALDIEVNNDLILEGIAREFINRIQNLRKDMGLAIQDKIILQVSSEHPEIVNAITMHQSYIQTEVQALDLQLVSDKLSVHIQIDDYILGVQIQKSNV